MSKLEESEFQVTRIPVLISKHEYPGVAEGEGSESGEGESGESGGEGGSNG